MLKKIIYLFIVVNFFVSSFVYAAKGDGNKYSYHYDHPPESPPYKLVAYDYDVLFPYVENFLALLQNDIDVKHDFTSNELTSINLIYGYILRNSMDKRPNFRIVLNFLVKNKEVFNKPNSIEFPYFVWELLAEGRESGYADIERIVEHIKKDSLTKESTNFYYKGNRSLSLEDLLVLAFVQDNMSSANEKFQYLLFEAVSKGDIDALKILGRTIDNARMLAEILVFKEFRRDIYGDDRSDKEKKARRYEYLPVINTFFLHERDWKDLLNKKSRNRSIGENLLTFALKEEPKNQTEILQYLTSKGVSPFYSNVKSQTADSLANSLQKELMRFAFMVFHYDKEQKYSYKKILGDTLHKDLLEKMTKENSVGGRKQLIQKYIGLYGVEYKIKNLTLLDAALEIQDTNIRLEVVEFLLKAGANSNATDRNGITTLQRAVLKRYPGENGPSYDLISIFLKYGANLTSRNNNNNSAMHGLDLYLEQGKHGKKYLEWKPDLIRLKYDYDVARGKGKIGIFEFILCKEFFPQSSFKLEVGEHVNYLLERALNIQYPKLRYNTISSLIKYGADVNATLPNGKTLFSLAIAKMRDSHIDYQLIAKMSHSANWNKSENGAETAKEIFKGIKGVSLKDKTLNLEAAMLEQAKNGETGKYSYINAKLLGFDNVVRQINNMGLYNFEDIVLNIEKNSENRIRFENEYREMIKKNKLNDLENYLVRGLDPEHKMKDGKQLIEYAVKAGSIEAVEMLFLFGAKSDVSSKVDIISKLEKKFKNDKEKIEKITSIRKEYESGLRNNSSEYNRLDFATLRNSINETLKLVGKKIRNSDSNDNFEQLVRLEASIRELNKKTAFENKFLNNASSFIRQMRRITRRAKSL